MTLTVGDIMVTPRTFFTCSSRDLAGNLHSAPCRVSLSPEGCLLVLSRIRRRLEAAGLALADALALFVEAQPNGKRDITAEQWLEAASSLPLGTSRAEMQQLYMK